MFSPKQVKTNTDDSSDSSDGSDRSQAGKPAGEGKSTLQRKDLSPGDWALIPAGVEHQEINEGEEEVVWVIVRSPGGVPEVVNLEGWSQPPVA